MNTLRQAIKEVATSQKDLKNQRKSVKIVGERTMSESQAAYYHGLNRVKLRVMYMALGLLRGKEQSQIELNPKEPINMFSLNKLIEKHGNEFTRDEESGAIDTGDTNG